MSVNNVQSPNSSTSSTGNNDEMPRATDQPTLTPLPPTPANWSDRYQNTVASLRNYQLFQVDPNTYEYFAIASLLDPAPISTVEQIVNPTLWTRFVNTRKDMLKSKCNDLELLSKLELNETDLMASYQHSLNFDTHPDVLAVPYNDNMALLFHCTRDQKNIENILRQGLDERMGSPTGLLGKGIYFSDDPEKSMSYDGCGGVVFIFAVLLGDCLAVNGQMYDFVREPEKSAEQKRNFNDLFFDSIVGQPGAGNYNEYVIYNRYQCCPLYMVNYQRGSYTSRSNPNSPAYVTSRQYFPPMGWTSTANRYVAPPQVQKMWPFYAKTVFAEMGPSVRGEDQSEADETNEELIVMKTDGGTTKKTARKLPRGLTTKLQQLVEMGFHDIDENTEVLKKHKYNLDKCVSYLINQK